MPAPRLVESSPLRLLLSVPEGGRTGAPVLCFLHGHDESKPANTHAALTRHGPLRAGSWPGALERFIIVAPQLPVRGDLWHRYADAVWDIVARTREAHGGDPARTYLTGFSFGGNGVFDLALRQPDRWAALWAVDPTRPPRTTLARPVWLSVGEIARSARGYFVRALDARDAAEVADVACEERLFLDEGADHVGSAALAYADERIYEWLLAKRLPAGALTPR